MLQDKKKKTAVRDSQPLSTSPKATDPIKKAARKTLRKNIKQVKEMPAARWEATPAAKRGGTKKQGIRALKKAARKTFR
jgi:hypothetical protein